MTSTYSPDSVLWFPLGMKEKVQKEISSLERKRIVSLRVGINCLVFNTKEGALWYDWLMSVLSKKFDLEPCFDKYYLHLPSKETSQNNSLHELVEYFISKYGHQFEQLELWKNPLDKFIPITSSTNIFSDELIFAATWAIFLNKKVIIGGIQAGDFEWLSLLINSGFLQDVSAIRLDSEGDLWSTNTNFFAQSIRSMLKEKDFKTVVFSNAPSIIVESV
ncbi:hypothetical protein [Algoriphagus persicinus]|uniref:hypothetical protein n=1 Tax=Algoriphagus persicinus TaxID=3108754 RepID=UPI002B391B65|nr:hypothetical protein [Algoriphagus sp. E1-3-M2]MEB2787225.1 hypothetical protein [Algoriphagus sp. E1-3-M2]